MIMTRNPPTRWIVEGADEETGEDQTLTIDAHDRKAAETQARRMGLLVSNIRQAPQPVVREVVRTPWSSRALDEQEMTLSTLAAVAPSAIAPAAAAPVAAATVNADEVGGSPIGYASPRGVTTPSADLFDELPPPYRSLQIASITLLVLAIAAYVVGLVTVWQVAIPSRWPADNLLYTVRQIGEWSGAIAIGAVLHGLSAGCGALRDMARNSFGRRHF